MTLDAPIPAKAPDDLIVDNDEAEAAFSLQLLGRENTR